MNLAATALDFTDYFQQTAGTPLQRFDNALRDALEHRYYQRHHGDAAKWIAALNALPSLTPEQCRFDTDAVTIGSDQQCNSEQRGQLEAYLKMLHPWRKGPWRLFGIDIDTEWRSNLKWQRVCDHIRPLQDRLVLDVGCGNGYYGWRMLAQQPRLVLGIDPSRKFLMQFQAFKRYCSHAPIHYLPLRDEDLPERMQLFDTVFSMGVLYHRRSPFDHLEQLLQCLTSGGELVLETLVIDGGEHQVLVPSDRYAQMPNVWFLPSCPTLLSWLARVGFVDARVVDVSRTTEKEQRRTDWMQFQSLTDYLDPDNPQLTIEGYQSPTRAIVVARKP